MGLPDKRKMFFGSPALPSRREIFSRGGVGSPFSFMNRLGLGNPALTKPKANKLSITIKLRKDNLLDLSFNK
jgi:hypothetical protein